MILSKIIAEELLKNKPADVKRPDFSKIEKLTSEGLEFLLENKVSINFPTVLEIEPEILSLFLKELFFLKILLYLWIFWNFTIK